MMLTDWDQSPESMIAQQKADAKLGIPDDAPEELRAAIRNMGPLTRKRFLKKLDREKITEEQYKSYIQKFT